MMDKSMQKVDMEWDGDEEHKDRVIFHFVSTHMKNKHVNSYS